MLARDPELVRLEISFQSLQYYEILRRSNPGCKGDCFDEGKFFETLCTTNFDVQWLNSYLLLFFNVSSTILISLSDFYGRKFLIVVGFLCINLCLVVFIFCESVVVQACFYGFCCGSADSVVQGFVMLINESAGAHSTVRQRCSSWFYFAYAAQIIT